MTPTKPLDPHVFSPLALRFLASLERRPSVPTAEVEAIILRSGYPCFAPWLTFHERYAGYLEVFGRDWAIWGLVQTNPVWLPPNDVEIEREPGEETWYITCADAHPSYGYQLDNTGKSLGFPPAESFDIRVERSALGWAIYLRGESRVLSDDELREAAFQEVFEKQIKSHLVPEASDRLFRYYMSDKYLVVEDAKTGAFRRGRIFG